MTIELTDGDDVRALLAQVSLFRIRPQRDRIAVRLPGVAPGDRLERELALNAAFHECGCSLGAAFMMLGLLTCAVYLWAINGGLWRASPGELIYSALIVLGFAVVGKLVGLVQAHFVLLSDLHALHKQVLTSEKRGQ
jgi:hypothetical protein